MVKWHLTQDRDTIKFRPKYLDIIHWLKSLVQVFCSLVLKIQYFCIVIFNPLALKLLDVFSLPLLWRPIFLFVCLKQSLDRTSDTNSPEIYATLLLKLNLTTYPEWTQIYLTCLCTYTWIYQAKMPHRSGVRGLQTKRYTSEKFNCFYMCVRHLNLE